jgi:hypothetical protein
MRHRDIDADDQIDLFDDRRRFGETGQLIGHEIGRASCRERVWLKV